LRVVNDVELGKCGGLTVGRQQWPDQVVNSTTDRDHARPLPWRNVLQATGGHLEG
jgi:hypothetical protein